MALWNKKVPILFRVFLRRGEKQIPGGGQGPLQLVKKALDIPDFLDDAELLLNLPAVFSAFTEKADGILHLLLQGADAVEAGDIVHDVEDERRWRPFCGRRVKRRGILRLRRRVKIRVKS